MSCGAQRRQLDAVVRPGSPWFLDDLPIRVLQAGVIPLIFALSLLLLPQMILAGLSAAGISWVTTASAWYAAFAANLWAYAAAYFLLVVMFTFFYTGITFEPKRVADNLQKSEPLFQVCVLVVRLRTISPLS